MIVTYCRYCGGQYTTLDANVSDSQAKRNQCLQCGRLLTRNPKSKWSHLFTPRRFNIDSEPLMLMLGQIILPDLKEEVFRRAFRGFLAEQDGSLIVRTSVQYGVDATPYRVNPVVHFGKGDVPLKPVKRPVTRKLCLLADTYRPKVLYVTTSLIDAFRIRYYVTDVDGIPPAVLFISLQQFSSRFPPILPVCNPDKVILLTSLSHLKLWVEAGNQCDLFHKGVLGSPLYFATRLLEDELEHPKHAFADPDTGKLRMDPEQLRDSCSAFSIEYATKTPAVGRRNVPQVSTAPKPADTLCRAILCAKKRKGDCERALVP